MQLKFIFSFFLLISVALLLPSDANGDDFVRKLEQSILEEISDKKIRKIRVGVLSQNDSFLKIDKIIDFPVDGARRFNEMLKSVEWSNSNNVATRKLTEFILIIETERGDFLGLHSQNSLEHDCFDVLKLSMRNENFSVTNQITIFSFDQKDGRQATASKRVLRIPNWRSTETGIKILELIND